MFQRGESREGDFGRGEAFDAKKAKVGLRREVGFAAVAEIKMQGGEGRGVREEVLDGIGGLEVVVAAVWAKGRERGWRLGTVGWVRRHRRGGRSESGRMSYQLRRYTRSRGEAL
jgi:hypothetical protein